MLQVDADSGEHTMVAAAPPPGRVTVVEIVIKHPTAPSGGVTDVITDEPPGINEATSEQPIKDAKDGQGPPVVCNIEGLPVLPTTKMVAAGGGGKQVAVNILTSLHATRTHWPGSKLGVVKEVAGNKPVKILVSDVKLEIKPGQVPVLQTSATRKLAAKALPPKRT